METVYFAKWILLDSGELLINGALSVSGTMITGVGPRSKVRRSSDSRIVNLGDVLVLPGLINMHIHLEDGIIRGSYKDFDETFAAWSAKKNTRIRTASPEQISATIRLTIKELIAQGITTIVDSTRYGHSLEILKNEHIRSWVIHELHTDDPNQEESLFETAKSKNKTTAGRTNFGIGPHAIFSLSPELQIKMVDFSKDNNVVWCTHMAESAEELQAFSEKKGDLYFQVTRKRPWLFGETSMGSMHYALSNNLIPHNGICVHCNYVNGQEIEQLTSIGASIVLCYSYTLEMGHKIFPLDVAMKRNCNICLGTEGIAPQGFISLFDELFALKRAYPHIPAKDLLMMVTQNPAKALGAQSSLGSITQGKFADFIAVRFPYDPNEDLLEELLMSEPEIALVVIDGEEIIYNC